MTSPGPGSTGANGRGLRAPPWSILLVLVIVLMLIFLLNGCDAPRATPRDAWNMLRAAIAARDGRALASMYEQDVIVQRRQFVRDRRSLLARGDAPEVVLRNVQLTAAEITAGTPDDALAIVLSRHSPLVRDLEWLREAEITSEEMDGEDSCLLVVRSAEGKEKRIWMLREHGRWVLDHHRTLTHPK